MPSCTSLICGSNANSSELVRKEFLLKQLSTN